MQDMMSGNILTERPLVLPGLHYHDALTISRMARYVQRLDKQVMRMMMMMITLTTVRCPGYVLLLNTVTLRTVPE